jgi:hypothetical protein
VREVRIVDFPLRVALRARQHVESLSREFAIIALGGGDEADVPKRLLEIARLSDERYGALNPEADAAVDEGFASNREFIDFTLYVPEQIKDDTVDMAPLLLEVDAYCRSGDLLTPPPSVEIRVFWFWFLGEIVRQVTGDQPTSWRGFDQPADMSDHDELLRRTARFTADPDDEPEP